VRSSSHALGAARPARLEFIARQYKATRQPEENTMSTTRTAAAPHAAALALAALMTGGLLSAMGLLANRYHADEMVAQGCLAPASQQVVVTAARGLRRS
jgi:hypothetical protein